MCFPFFIFCIWVQHSISVREMAPRFTCSKRNKSELQEWGSQFWWHPFAAKQRFYGDDRESGAQLQSPEGKLAKPLSPSKDWHRWAPAAGADLRSEDLVNSLFCMGFEKRGWEGVYRREGQAQESLGLSWEELRFAGLGLRRQDGFTIKYACTCSFIHPFIRWILSFLVPRQFLWGRPRSHTWQAVVSNPWITMKTFPI